MRISRLVRGLLAAALFVVSMSGLSSARPTLLRTLNWQQNAKEVSSVAFSPDGKNVVTVGVDGQIRIWPVDEDRSPRVFAQDATQALYSPDGRFLAGLIKGRITLFDAATLKDVGHVLAPEPLERFAWQAGVIAAVGADSAFVIDVESHELLRTFSGASRCVSMDAAAKLCGAFADGMATVWSVTSGKMKCTVQAGQVMSVQAPDPKVCTAIAISPDKRLIVTADQAGMVMMYALPSGDLIKKLLICNETGTVDVAFTSDSRRFAAIATHGGVKVFDAAFNLLATISDSGTVGAFSPNGKLLAVGRDQGVRIWNLDLP